MQTKKNMVKRLTADEIEMVRTARKDHSWLEMQRLSGIRRQTLQSIASGRVSSVMPDTYAGLVRLAGILPDGQAEEKETGKAPKKAPKKAGGQSGHRHVEQTFHCSERQFKAARGLMVQVISEKIVKLPFPVIFELFMAILDAEED